jgi:hypothetical protein
MDYTEETSEYGSEDDVAFVKLGSLNKEKVWSAISDS